MKSKTTAKTGSIKTGWLVAIAVAGAVVLGGLIVAIGLVARSPGFDANGSGHENFYADQCPGNQVAVEVFVGLSGIPEYTCGQPPICSPLDHLEYINPYGGGVVYDAYEVWLKCVGPLDTPDFTVDKPVIYLYPQSKTDVSVNLNYDGQIITYPEIGDGWQVSAEPTGKLFNYADGREYSYLYWEGEPSQPRTYDWSQGFIVKGTDSREFLQEKLAEIGLTPREYNEFIVYWYPKLLENEYNLIHFANEQEYGKFAPLDISPKPDSMLRVFMVARPATGDENPTPQQFDAFRRDGFTVVEWGGSQVK